MTHIIYTHIMLMYTQATARMNASDSHYHCAVGTLNDYHSHYAYRHMHVYVYHPGFL